MPDLLVDCTSAYGSLDGYVPSGLTAEQARESRARRRRELSAESARFDGGPDAGDSGAKTARVAGIPVWRRSWRARPGAGAGEKRPKFPISRRSTSEPLWSEGRALLSVGGSFRRACRHRARRPAGAGDYSRATRPPRDGFGSPANMCNSKGCRHGSAWSIRRCGRVWRGA